MFWTLSCATMQHPLSLVCWYSFAVQWAASPVGELNAIYCRYSNTLTRDKYLMQPHIRLEVSLWAVRYVKLTCLTFSPVIIVPGTGTWTNLVSCEPSKRSPQYGICARCSLTLWAASLYKIWYRQQPRQFWSSQVHGHVSVSAGSSYRSIVECWQERIEIPVTTCIA